MCGRYVIINGRAVPLSFSKIHFESLKDPFSDLPRYNAAPRQQLPVIAVRHESLVAEKMRWWLVPHWSKDGSIKATTFNAKSETLAESKLFAPYFKSSRCLVPADAFYEWKRISEKEKHPMCIRMKDKKAFLFAGLFSVWKNEKGEEFPGFSIITTTPNTLMSRIHVRMPVILPEKHFEQWLDREFKDLDALKKLLVPYTASKMEAFEVSDFVNNPRNEGKECMESVDEQMSN